MSATGLDGRFPDVFMAMASCADAKVQLFGLPYEAWSGLLFAAILLAMFAVVFGRERGRRR
jgi:disulfide bond formation protein DsbB